MISGLEIMLTGVGSAFAAQVIKLGGYLVTHRKINFKILSTTGGMPSSHSSGTVAMSTAVGLISGFGSEIFAVSAGFTLVVMYDAAGLRRAAGKTAASLNRIMEDFYEGKPVQVEKLKELLGHTPFEVFMGAILGVVLAYFNHYILFA